jgi:hypothetical protein
MAALARSAECTLRTTNSISYPSAGIVTNGRSVARVDHCDSFTADRLVLDLTGIRRCHTSPTAERTPRT